MHAETNIHTKYTYDTHMLVYLLRTHTNRSSPEQQEMRRSLTAESDPL